MYINKIVVLAALLSSSLAFSESKFSKVLLEMKNGDVLEAQTIELLPSGTNLKNFDKLEVSDGRIFFQEEVKSIKLLSGSHQMKGKSGSGNGTGGG